MANTFIPIASYTLGSTPSTINFSNIPQTYNDLCFFIMARSPSPSHSLDFVPIRFRFNGDNTANYYYQAMLYSGSSGATSQKTAGETYFQISNALPAVNNDSSVWSNFEIYIPRYKDTGYYHNWICQFGASANATNLSTGGVAGGLWAGTSAITSIEFDTQNYFFSQNSILTLYGIKNT